LHSLYPQTLEHLERYSREERDLIERALAFARERHEGQTRLDGPPYLYHLIAVAQLLVANAADAQTVAAGLLHDTLEDTKTSLAEIEERFGPSVRFLVDGATETGRGDGREPIPDRDARTAATHEKIRSMVREDPRVWLVKGCDRWHNLLTCENLRVKSRIRWSSEALEFHVPGLRSAGFTRVADALALVARGALERAQGAFHHGL
jgi:GTP pyrophosphokinase